MPDIIEELLESFKNSSQQLEGLSEGLEELQKAQALVEDLSSNLSDAASALKGTATSHDNFIKSAQVTNSQLGEIISVLNGLDTTSINTSLGQIKMSLSKSEETLANLLKSFSDAEAKASATDKKLDSITSQLEAISAANTSLSAKVDEAQKFITDRANEATNSLIGRQKQLMIVVILILAASSVLVGNLFGVLPF